MPSKSNEIKNKLLGEPFGTAWGKLRKMLLFDLASKLNLTICHRCEKKIETHTEFSIEHTISWQTAPNPREVFFNLKDIRFSHLICNCRATKFGIKKMKHPSRRSYNKGCRCDECRKINTKATQIKRAKRKLVRLGRFELPSSGS